MKKWKLFMTAAILTISSTITALAGTWQKDNVGWYYSYEDGSYAYGGWQTIDGVDYYFNWEGYLQTGWQHRNGKRIFYTADGNLGNGWVQDDIGRWYYINPDGTIKTGWLNDGTGNYYLWEDGASQNYGQPAVGTQLIGGKTYYFYADGRLANNEMDLSGTKMGVQRRFNNGVAEWKSVSSDRWITYTTKAQMTYDLEDQLTYLANTKNAYKTVIGFKKAVELYMTDLLDESERNTFIYQVAKNHRKKYGSSGWTFEADDVDEDYID